MKSGSLGQAMHVSGVLLGLAAGHLALTAVGGIDAGCSVTPAVHRGRLARDAQKERGVYATAP